jgi:hypothetical protein
VRIGGVFQTSQIQPVETRDRLRQLKNFVRPSQA